MSLSSHPPAGIQAATTPVTNHRDIEEEAYIVAWISYLNDFTTGYTNSLVQYFNPSGNISNAALLSYIHRRNKTTAQYHPQPTKIGWRANVPPKRTPAYFAYWAARESK